MDTTSEAHEVSWMAKGASKDNGKPVKPPPPSKTLSVTSMPASTTIAPKKDSLSQPLPSTSADTITQPIPIFALSSTHTALVSTSPPSDMVGFKSSSPLLSASEPLKPVTSAPQTFSSSNGSVTASQSVPSSTSPLNVRRRSSVGEKKEGSLRRTPSWFTNISNKFSSSAPNGAANGISAEVNPSAKNGDKKNGVLPTASKTEGETPYVPAPVKSPQSGLRGVLRRLSQSGPFANVARNSVPNHGLVERKILNVDYNRERCKIAELQQQKLRRVAFCVDVEIAPMPKYKDSEPSPAGSTFSAEKSGVTSNVNDVRTPPATPTTPTAKLSMTEKAEGEALKKGVRAAKAEAEKNGIALDKTLTKLTTVTENPVESKPALAPAKANPLTNGHFTKTDVEPKTNGVARPPDINIEAANGNISTDLKDGKHKKKRTEEERRARRERKRRLAESNGQIPMELHLESDTEDESIPRTPLSAATIGTGVSEPKVLSPRSVNLVNLKKPTKTASSPTSNPVRIYRRCCQLRETPILKRITEQLLNPDNINPTTGVVDKLDFTNFHLQGPDFVTLGDYFAVVPVKEVNFENAGLDDAALRVVLAGLLVVRLRDPRRRRHHYDVTNVKVIPGGVVEKLHLSYNKFGPEGWKNLALFVNMCRSLQQLDVSHLNFPKPIFEAVPQGVDSPRTLVRLDTANLFSRALKERLAGATLELLNMGATYMAPEQLSVLVDGALGCGVKRLSLANMHMDGRFVPYVKRFLASPICNGLDLGSNNLNDHIEEIMGSIGPDSNLSALSLANCHLEPKALNAVFPSLLHLKDFRFLDLSSNIELFREGNIAMVCIRKYLPQMISLRRIHLSNVSMTSEQAIMMAEILPEIKGLAHITLLNNKSIQALADAHTKSEQEEACALYAALLAAARISKSLICVDIDIPTENSSEVVRAIAQQIVAYCLRNLAHVPMSETAPSTAEPEQGADKIRNPEVLAHLVGHGDHDEADSDNSEAPDDNYVIGGTGVVKALQACLNSHMKGAETVDDASGEESADGDKANKALDVTKHLLMSARKIRTRLQPALARAQCSNSHDVRRLLFLNNTLNGIITRFEDEFPDTREHSDAPLVLTKPREVEPSEIGLPASPTTPPGELSSSNHSDGEEDTIVHIPGILSRSSSMIFHSSRQLAEQEGRALRTGHRFRAGMMRKEHYDLFLNSLDEIGQDPDHISLLHQMIGDVDDAEINAKVEAKGVVQTFKEERALIMQRLRDKDPEHWDNFVESQEKARANVTVPDNARPAALGLLGVDLSKIISTDSTVSEDAMVSGDE